MQSGTIEHIYGKDFYREQWLFLFITEHIKTTYKWEDLYTCMGKGENGESERGDVRVRATVEWLW